MLKKIINKLMLLTFVFAGLSSLQVKSMRKTTYNKPILDNNTQTQNLINQSNELSKPATKDIINLDFYINLFKKQEFSKLTSKLNDCDESMLNRIFKELYEKNKDFFDSEDANDKSLIEILCKEAKIKIFKIIHKNKAKCFNLRDLTYACDNNRLDVITYLHNQSPELFDLIDADSKTLTDYVCNSKMLNIVAYLYEQNPKLFLHTDIDGKTPVFSATCNDSLDVVKYLYKQDPTLFDYQDKDGRTPIFEACLSDCLNVVKYLYDQKTELFDHQNKSGFTPIFEAFFNNSLSVVEYLYGKDILLLQHKNKDNQNCILFCNSSNSGKKPDTNSSTFKFIKKKLSTAIKNIDNNTVNYINSVCKQKNIEIYYFNDKNQFLKFYNSNSEIYNKKENIITQIKYSCQNDNENVIEFFFNQNQDIFIKKNDNGILSINTEIKQVGKKVQNFLNKKLSSLNAKDTYKYIEEENWTELTNFIKNNQINNELLEYQNKDNETLLMLACKANKNDLAALILKKSSKTYLESTINQSDTNGYTAISHAINNKMWSTIKAISESLITNKIIETPVKINSDNTKESYLQQACKNNAPIRIIKTFTTTKTINLSTDQNNTPLYLAFKNNNIKTIKYLLLNGAKINKKIEQDFILNEEENEEIDENAELVELKKLLMIIINSKENKIQSLDENIMNKEEFSTSKNEKQKNNYKLAINIVIHNYLIIDEKNTDHQLAEKLFNSKNAKCALEADKTKDLYSFIKLINKNLKLNIDEDIIGNLTDSCTICTKKVIENNAKMILQCCKRKMHKECYKEFLKKSTNTVCTLCRAKPRLDSAFQNNSWDWGIAKNILESIDQGSINLTKNPDLECLDIAIEQNEKDIIKLLLDKNTNLLTQDNNIYITEENKDQDYNELLVALEKNDTNKVNKLLEQLLPTETKTDIEPEIQTNKNAPKYIIRIKNGRSKNTKLTRKETLKTNHGWIEPTNDYAKAAMKIVKGNPEGGYILDNVIMADRGHKDRDGWKKVIQVIYHINGNILNEPIEIHYNLKTIPTKNEFNVNIYESDRFKFKEYRQQDLTQHRQKTFKGENINN